MKQLLSVWSWLTYKEDLTGANNRISFFVFETGRLKQKLTKDFPNLVFHRPTTQTKSNIVYVESVQPGPLLEHFRISSSSSTSITYETEMDLPSTSGITKSRSGDANNVYTLYNAAMIIKTQL